jgi:transcriptional regulator with XRE-family HTH domain
VRTSVAGAPCDAGGPRSLQSDALPSFAAMLRGFRERSGRPRNALAHEVGIDPSYMTRLEQGDRDPPRPAVVGAIAAALHLSIVDHNRLLVAAGYTPFSVLQLGDWNATLQAVTDVLNDQGLSEAERTEFGKVVESIAIHWRAQGTDASPE